ncbi:hypothetical protein F2P56_024665 [Juglans regia]|uniref:Integrase catalytic domain-containing protein n=1 Tax=Juglans regia TaxID=51240 RepID=A0A833X9F3_JUGRE|nr:hypothetical protein F2P56_024665 [Juglans regia]
MEMLAFALVITARRLRPYFQAHPIKVQTDVPLRKILQKPYTSGRTTNWAIEVSEFEIEYLPRIAIKGQVLANFVAEFSDFLEEMVIMPQGKSWQVYVDDSSCRNEVEDEALLSGLTIARSLGATEVEVKVDSHIVVGQENAPITHCPPEKLTSVTAPWPFAQWGLDLIGPLPTGKGGVKFVVVAVDYFMKWVEAEALATITAHAITSFHWKSIICRFGIPQSFISDNGRQFNCSHYREWFSELRIKTKYSSLGHSQANGQVEATNKTLLNILKKKLGGQKGEWA